MPLTFSHSAGAHMASRVGTRSINKVVHHFEGIDQEGDKIQGSGRLIERNHFYFTIKL